MSTLEGVPVRADWMSRITRAASQNVVPILFGILCVIGVIAAGIPLPFLLNEVITRLARNLFLVLSLIIPVVAGWD